MGVCFISVFAKALSEVIMNVCEYVSPQYAGYNKYVPESIVTKGSFEEIHLELLRSEKVLELTGFTKAMSVRR